MRGGLGVLGWLTIIFVVAKIFNLVDWNWVIVFVPLYIGVGLTLSILAFFVILAVLRSAGD